MIKLSKEDKNRAKALGAVLAATTAKAVLSDFPKGALEKVTEDAVDKALNKQNVLDAFKRSAWKEAVTGRALGRAAGGLAVGLPTFPVYLSGVNDLRSDDTKDKAIGIGKVVGSGILYSGGKGGIEYAIESKASKAGESAFTAMRRGAFARMLPNTATALPMAFALAHSTKKPKNNKKRMSPVLVGTLVGGLGASAKGMSEALIDHTIKSNATKDIKFADKAKAFGGMIKQPKIWAPKTVARGLGGALGGGVLGLVTKKIMDRKDK